jgi:large conductance mechanosensitive channel
LRNKTLFISLGLMLNSATDLISTGEKIMSMMQEFKEFAIKGNVVDMAVVMPPIGVLIGGVDFSKLSFILQDATATAPAVVISYGKFIQTVVDFTIIAAVIFMVIKGINSMKKKAETAPATPAAPPVQEVLLTEIRDLLKK